MALAVCAAVFLKNTLFYCPLSYNWCSAGFSAFLSFFTQEARLLPKAGRLFWLWRYFLSATNFSEKDTCVWHSRLTCILSPSFLIPFLPFPFCSGRWARTFLF